MKIPQQFPEKVGILHPVKAHKIASEPVFRRGDLNFVEGMGGPFAKKMLQIAEIFGMVRSTTRMLVQKTPVVSGAYPDIPQWHVDCMPGVPTKLADVVRQKIDGLICVLLDKEANPDEQGTLFLKGELDLDMDPESDSDYKPDSHLSRNSGNINWIHPQVEAQLGRTVEASHLEPNTIYRYSSDQFHIAPVMNGSSGQRIVIRLNTPPEDYPHVVPVTNQLIRFEPSYFFQANEDHTTWQRKYHEIR